MTTLAVETKFARLSPPQARRLILAVALLGTACEIPPGNSARYWEYRTVQSPDTAGPAIQPDPEDPPLAGMGGDGTGGVGSMPQGGGSSGADAGGSGIGVGGAGGGGGQAGDAGLQPPVDTGGPDVVATGTACSMMVKLTTVTTNSDYAPDNVGAVWIADAGGKFVKSLEVWANRRISHLNKWVAATTAAGRARDTVDAVTSATASKHSTHSLTWNCTAPGGTLLPRGSYQLCMEMNESNNQSIAYQCVKFENAGVAFKLMPPDVAYFKGRVLDYAAR